MQKPESSAMRAALLKQLIDAIGSNRIKGFSVEKVDLHDPMEMGEDVPDDESDPLDAHKDEMESQSSDTSAESQDESPEEIQKLLEEARAARKAKMKA